MEKVKLTSEQKLRSLARKQYYDENYLGVLKTYQQIIDICPYDAESIYQLMTNYVSIGIFPYTTSEYSFDEEGKLKDDEKWIDIDPSDLGEEDAAESIILKEAYQLETSISTIHETLVKMPNDPKARLALAVCYEYWNDYPEAIDIYQVLALPENVIELRLSALKRLVQCYKEIENDEAVGKTISQVEELSGQTDSDPEMNYERAMLAYRSRDFSKAQEQLQCYVGHPNLIFRDDIQRREVENKILFAKFGIFMGSQDNDKASKLIRAFVDKMLDRKNLYRTDIAILPLISGTLESLKDLDYLKLLVKRQEILHKPDLSLTIHHNISLVSMAIGNHVERFDALLKMKQNVYTLLRGDYADLWKGQLNVEPSPLYDNIFETSDLSINEYVESNLSDLKNTLKDSKDKRVQQINEKLTKLEEKIKAEHEEEEKNLVVNLTTADSKIDFECKVMGYQFPEITDTYDSNWINLNVQFSWEGEHFNETMGFLEYRDLDFIYKWFEALSKHQLPFTVFLGFLEPDISFRYIGCDEDTVTVNIELRWHLDPNYDSDDEINAESVFELQFKLDNDDFENILTAFDVARRRYGSGIR